MSAVKLRLDWERKRGSDLGAQLSSGRLLRGLSICAKSSASYRCSALRTRTRSSGPHWTAVSDLSKLLAGPNVKQKNL